MRHLRKEIALCWRDSSVIRVTRTRVRFPEPTFKKADVGAHTSNLIIGETKTGRSRMFAAQSAWPTLGNLQTSERPCPRKSRDRGGGEGGSYPPSYLYRKQARFSVLMTKHVCVLWSLQKPVGFVNLTSVMVSSYPKLLTSVSMYLVLL